MVAGLVNCRLSGENIRRGDSAGSRLLRESATGPACPIWAETAAPSACTAAVSRCSPGSASGRQWIWCRSVRPSGETAR